MPRKRLEGNVIVPDLVADPTGRSGKAVGKDGKDFKPSARRLGLFKRANGDWKEPDEWPGYPAVLVCRTEGCHMNGVEVESQVKENVDGVFRAGCGPCGQAITEMWVDEAVTPLPLDPPANPAPAK